MSTCKNCYTSIVVCAALFFLHSCQIVDGPCEKGKGDLVKRELSISSFSGINMTMAGQVIIEKGEEIKVEVEGQPNILDLLSTDIDDELWTIYPRNCVSSYKQLVIYVTVPSLTYLSLTGSGELATLSSFEGNIEMLLSGSGQISYEGIAEKASLVLSGSGKMTVMGEFAELSARHSSSGSMYLGGITDFLTLHCSGSGSVNAYEMIATRAQISSSGSGDIEVYVSEQLEPVLTGSGSLYYKGYPSIIDAVQSGSGKIIDAN